MRPSSSGNASEGTVVTPPIRLLVEGKDFLNFACAELQDLGRRDVEVQDFGGVTELRQFLAGFVRTPGFSDVQSVGIMRDAENSAAAAFQSIKAACAAADLPVPERPGKRQGSRPSVTVLIVPTDQQSGMLETLLWRTVSRTSEAACVEDFLACVERIPDRKIVRRDKARMHAWIATQKHPEVSVGVAARKKYLRLDHSALSGVREFLQAL